MSATGTRGLAGLAAIVAIGAVLLACERGPGKPPGDSTAGAGQASVGPPTVYFQELKAFLPDRVEGYTQVRERGSTGKYGEVSVSEAERVFRVTGAEGAEAEAQKEISVRIVDTSISERLGKSIRAAVEEGARKAHTDPTAPIQLRDALGFVRYDPDEEQAEANLLVGDRYVVAVTTRGFQSTTEAREIAHSLDLQGLAQLR